jgi:hypothetical protein
VSREEDDEGYVFEDCEIIHQTDRALKVRLDDGTEIWVPKSVVHDNSEIWKAEEKGDLTVKHWWARSSGYA